MKVSSPVGEFPFEVRGLSLRRGAIRVDGAMGAWPAHVEMTLADLPALARAAPVPAAVALALVTAGAFTLRAALRSTR